jgi:hypothetical protein
MTRIEYSELIKDKKYKRVRSKEILKNGTQAECKIVVIDSKGLMALYDKVPCGIGYTVDEALQYLECYE